MDISRGQRLKVTEIVGESARFDLIPEIDGPGLVIDYSVFGIDASGKLAGDDYLCFFNSPVTPCRSVELTTSGSSAKFAFELAKLPQKIDRLVLTASIDGPCTMSMINFGSVRFDVEGGNRARFSFRGSDFAAERALILGEFYRKDGLWRFSATGQGFNGGLDALIRHFGGEVAEPVVVQQPKVSLSKVTLTKAGETHKVSLAKGAGAPAKLIVKATWTDNGDGSADNDDLDLRVGVLFPDGRMYFVTAPDAPGSLERVPYVRHLGDVTGASKNEPATETVEVNPSIANLVGGPVTLVFSIYSALANGTVSVASMSPKMRMEYGLQIVECAYDFSAMKGGDDGVYTYVIGTASISGDAIELSPSGMTSTAGTENTPWLSRTAGGSIRISMDGPAVFKAALRSKETKYNASNPRRYS